MSGSRRMFGSESSQSQQKRASVSFPTQSSFVAPATRPPESFSSTSTSLSGGTLPPISSVHGIPGHLSYAPESHHFSRDSSFDYGYYEAEGPFAQSTRRFADVSIHDKDTNHDGRAHSRSARKKGRDRRSKHDNLPYQVRDDYDNPNGLSSRDYPLHSKSRSVHHERYANGNGMRDSSASSSRAPVATSSTVQLPVDPRESFDRSHLPNGTQIVTVETEQGPMSIPMDMQAASRVADEKRRRNAGASARFRARRKEKEDANTRELDHLRQQVNDLSEDVDFYQRERDVLAHALQTANERHPYLPRPASPRQRRPPSHAFPPLHKEPRGSGSSMDSASSQRHSSGHRRSDT